MRTLLTLLLIPALAPAMAQITIGPADMPSAGDTMRYRAANAEDVDLTQTGAGVVWDFSTLVPGAEDADTAVSVSSTPFLFQFYFNNPFLYPEHDADFAMKGQDFGFQTFLTVSNLFDYYARDAADYRSVGFGANINGLPTSIRRIPVDLIHRFPMNFGDEDSSFSSFELDIPTVFSFQQDQWRYNTVDGWGTLYLPADTFQVLRVRSVLQRSDTVYVDQFGFGIRFDEPETVEYRWLALGMDQPVLRVTVVGGQPASARFVHEPGVLPTAMSDRTLPDGPVLFPNPSDAFVTIRHSPLGDVTLDLLDAAGRVVRAAIPAASSGSTVVPVHDLAPGVYAFRLTGAERWTRRFMVRH